MVPFFFFSLSLIRVWTRSRYHVAFGDADLNSGFAGLGKSFPWKGALKDTPEHSKRLKSTLWHRTCRSLALAIGPVRRNPCDGIATNRAFLETLQSFWGRNRIWGFVPKGRRWAQSTGYKERQLGIQENEENPDYRGAIDCKHCNASIRHKNVEQHSKTLYNWVGGKKLSPKGE